MSDTIAVFTMNVEEQIREFRLEAQNYSLNWDDQDIDIEFDEVEIYELFENGEVVRFTPEGFTWAGRPIDGEYACRQITAAYLNGEDAYDFSYVCDELSGFSWRGQGVACQVGDRSIPYKFFEFSLGLVYDLELITNEFVYYTYEEMVLMVSIEKWEVLSNNYFAEEALLEDMENIVNGTLDAVWMSDNAKYYREELVSQMKN